MANNNNSNQNNQTSFKVRSSSINPVQHLSAHLDLTNKPVGNCYFNRENNYNYTKNPFNYTQFQIINGETVINEVVQSTHPDLVTNTLDSSKTYQLPSTNLTPEWMARIESGYPGFSGFDANGNTYVLANYDDLNDAQIYDSNNVLDFTQPNNGANSTSVCLTKYNSSGNALWSARIHTQNSGQKVFGNYCITDNEGTTYVTGTSNTIVEFEDATGTIVYTVDLSGKSFLIAYDTSGTPNWITYFTGDNNDTGILWVDNLEIGNVYVLGGSIYGTTFYDGVPIAPTPVLVVPPGKNLTLSKFRASSGLFQWATYLDGYRVNIWRDYLDNGNQSLTTDPFGNVYLTGYYTQMDPLVNAATTTNPVFIESEITVPPYSSPVVWTPYETDRNWSAVDLSLYGEIIVATVANGFIYICRNLVIGNPLYSFEIWEPTATIQNWSSVYCSELGDIIVATIYDSVIYRSTDSGVTWLITGSEGSNARHWNSIAGTLDGQYLVATTVNEYMYYSNDYGATWSQSNSILAQWIDVAYSASVGAFVAVIKNGPSYYSVDGGITWVLSLGPTKNWSAITGSRVSGFPSFVFFATVEGGEIYGVDYGGNWSIVESTNRDWSDIAMGSGDSGDSNLFASVMDGAIYQTIYTDESIWTATTSPRKWNRVAMSQGNIAVATVNGGQIYISINFFPQRHTFLVKYNPEGVVQWANYVNCPSSQEADNIGISLTTKQNGEIVLFGVLGNNSSGGIVEFFSPDNFTLPIKTLSSTGSGRYLVCYSPEGLPLWVNQMQLYTFSNFAQCKTLTTDEFDNIYCIGYTDGDVNRFYNPTGQLVYEQALSQSTILIKYYPDGSFQSFATIRSDDTITYRPCFGNSIRVINQDIYLTGWANIISNTTVQAFSSDETTTVSNLFNLSGIFIVKYSCESSSPFNFPSPGYNSPFQTQLTTGGSVYKLLEGYVYNGPVEPWGGQTGFTPGPITLNDANTGVIAHYGHEPGYTHPENHTLTVHLSEPSFPLNDPQPVTPGTIPYGFLPVFISFPDYTESVVFNTEYKNDIYSSVNAMLYAVGTVPESGLSVSGVSAGDIIRLLIETSTNSQYITLTVKGFVLSQPTIGLDLQIPAAIVFEEPVEYLQAVIGAIQTSSSMLVTVGDQKYLSAFVQPILIRSGTLQVSLETNLKSNA